MSDRDPGDGPSWDEGRRQAPSRPSFRTSLPEPTPLPRPQHVLIALALVLVAALAFVAVTALAGLDHVQVRADLVAGLPEEADEYSDKQVRRAVWVLVGAAAGLGALLSLAQVLSIRSAAVRRSLPSRTTFVTVAVLYLPVAVISWAIRAGGLVDDVLSVVNIVCLVAAAVLITRRPVAAWLRQTERTGRAPLVPPAPGDEMTPAAAGRRPLHQRRTSDAEEGDSVDEDQRELASHEGLLSLEARREDDVKRE
ncbi:hypothetical protein ACHAAC_09550 [Aeromicrobium sp. CF4.19]|uniref:hypothetical protein n=1 Tax=Aeromicrobium sp. CF4.19 TaxID=3373082 RepID=UPI003EE69A8B